MKTFVVAVFLSSTSSPFVFKKGCRFLSIADFRLRKVPLISLLPFMFIFGLVESKDWYIPSCWNIISVVLSQVLNNVSSESEKRYREKLVELCKEIIEEYEFVKLNEDEDDWDDEE